MADSVIDILTRLSYDVKSDDLNKVIDQLKQQSATLVDLNKQVENYQIALKDAAASDVNTQKQLQAELARTKTARDNVAASIVNSVKSNSQATNALKGEIGLIQQLNDKLLDLRHNKERATTVGQIKDINVAMAATQKQLQDLSKAGGNNILGNLLGVGQQSLPRQILQGALFSFGIGSGFGLITRLTSALFDFAQEELDTEAKTEKLIAATDKLSKSLDGIGEELITLANQRLLIYQDATNTTVDALQRQADAVKALGVQNGETYIASANQLSAEQKVREEKIKQLEREKKITDDVATAISSANRYAQEYISNPDVINNSADRNPQANKNVQYDIYNNTLKKLATSGLPQDIVDKLSVELNKSFKDNGDIVKALSDKAEQTAAASAKSNQGLLNAQQEKENADLEFTSKNNEQISELKLSLLQRVRSAEEQYNILKRKDAVETSDLIMQRLKLEHDESLAALNDEVVQARKKGLLTAATIKQFGNLGALINATFNANFKQQNFDFLQRNSAANNSFTGNLNKTDLSQSSFNITSAVQNGGLANFSEYERNVKAQNEILLDDFYSYYTAQYEAARKNGIDTTTLDEKYARDYSDIIKKQTSNALSVYQQYFLDLSKLIQSETETLLLKADLAGAADIEKLSERLGKGIFSGGISTDKYNRLKGLSELKTGIREDATNIVGTSEQLTAAQDNLSSVQANPDASTQDVKNAQADVDKLQSKLDKFNTDLHEKEDELKNAEKEYIIRQIDGFQLVLNAAITAYQGINAAHEKYLDTEISIQTERVNEAQVLAQRGNTVALQQQSELLQKEQQQKELFAKRDLEINTALTISNSILTVAKAAVEGGPGAAFTIAAAIIALGVGIVEATQLGTQNTPSFATGGFTGHGGKFESAGIVHKGEFVNTAEHTAKYRPLLEAIHHGYDPMPVLARGYTTETHTRQSDFSLLGKLMKENTEAIYASKTEVNAHFDEHGMGIATQRAISANARRWKG